MQDPTTQPDCPITEVLIEAWDNDDIDIKDVLKAMYPKSHQRVAYSMLQELIMHGKGQSVDDAWTKLRDEHIEHCRSVGEVVGYGE